MVCKLMPLLLLALTKRNICVTAEVLLEKILADFDRWNLPFVKCGKERFLSCQNDGQQSWLFQYLLI